MFYCYAFLVSCQVTERHHDLNIDEVKVIEGVLKLGQVTCVQVMTRIESVFMLPLQTKLNYETINDIIKSGKELKSELLEIFLYFNFFLILIP